MNTVQSISQPVYASTDKSSINCMVQFDTFPSPIPFTASKNDSEERGRNIYDSLVGGSYGEIENYVDVVLTSAQKNVAIYSQISTLEASQGRAIREATLTMPGAVDRLSTLNNKIVDLRKQLIS